MYEAFFGFRTLPFRMAPDPKFLYFSRQHKTAFAHLEYALVHDAAFCLITGEIGSGKTTLVRHLLTQLPSSVTSGLMSDTSRDIHDLLGWVNLSFELPVDGLSPIMLRKQFQEFLVQQYSSKRKVLLIVDEAQNLGRRNLEELRLLSNINAEQDVLLQVVLVGQPELRDLILDERLRQIAQRVSIQFHLRALNAEETAEYVRHRLRTAGGPDDTFTPNALRLVYLHSRGVPRLINRLCDHALVHGFSAGERKIVNGAIAEVVESMTGGFG